MGQKQMKQDRHLGFFEVFFELGGDCPSFPAGLMSIMVAE